MAKKEIQSKIEREYIIPLRSQVQKTVRYKKTPKAVRTVKEFLVQHMQIRDRDTKKIKLDKKLNEMLWIRGIKNPPHKIKVRAVKEGDIVRVYAVDLPSNLHYKQLREEKLSSTAKEMAEKKKTLMQKAKEQLQGTGDTKEEVKEDKDKDGVKDKKEEREKTEAIKETAQKENKAKAKEAKKDTLDTKPIQKKKEHSKGEGNH
jgi:large subunit ribosomal protein L31e